MLVSRPLCSSQTTGGAPHPRSAYPAAARRFGCDGGPAGPLEAVGLKGHKIGNMAFSELHANFMINLGGGTYDEAIELMQLAQKKVYERFGIWLENEVAIIDSRFIGKNDPSNPPRTGQ